MDVCILLLLCFATFIGGSFWIVEPVTLKEYILAIFIMPICLIIQFIILLFLLTYMFDGLFMTSFSDKLKSRENRAEMLSTKSSCVYNAICIIFLLFGVGLFLFLMKMIWGR